jgi:hypothetical protein
MSEQSEALAAAHTAISDLAAVLVAVMAGLDGDCVRARNHLEMGEIGRNRLTVGEGRPRKGLLGN